MRHTDATACSGLRLFFLGLDRIAGFDHAVVDWCLSHEIAVTPGVVTPTEITAALDMALFGF